MSEKIVKILIGGDLLPTENNIKLFETAKIKEICGEELLKKLADADFRIFNLEGPITDIDKPIIKSGPVLKASTKSWEGIKELKPDLISLANNHILDQGKEGLRDTITLIKKDGIKYIGAGDCLEEARKAVVLKKNGIRIGVYACAEHEFTIAGKAYAGANPFDALDSPDFILELKRQVDMVIVLYHGGRERYRYPSPYIQRVFRKLAEKGADIVISQHTHCIGCMEQYKDSFLIYGQGNFIFCRENSEAFNTGLFLEIEVIRCKEEKLRKIINFYPLEVVDEYKVRIMRNTDAQDILSGFQARSMDITKEGFVESNFQKYAKKSFSQYGKFFLGQSIEGVILRILNKISEDLANEYLAKIIYKKDREHILNTFQCEAHCEMVQYALKRKK